jgi:anti-sigma regulatory factor (Ser/Thr protein kinase)
MWTLSKHSRQLALAHSQLESVVLQRTAELQILTQRLLKVQDEERRKLSRELHDSTGQTLAALKISISFLEENCSQDPASVALISAVEELANQAIEEIRTMSYLLHPPLLDEVGLSCAAEWYVEGFAKRSGVNVTLDIATPPKRLPTRIEFALFRVLQESLTNVHRHSGASAVSVRLEYRLDEINLEIRDNGRGIAAERLARLRKASPETGVGLAGMRERMHELNGKLEVESDGQGTIMRAFVPLPAISPSGHLRDCVPVNVPPIPGSTQRRLPDCCVCNRPVLLETSKTDEYGQAVHEQCYVLKHCSTAEFLDDVASTSSPANRHALCQPCAATVPEGWESRRPRQPDVLATMSSQQVSSHKRLWSVGLAAVATVLLLTCWFAYGDGQAPSFFRALEVKNTAAIAEQVPLPPGNVVPAEARSKFRHAPIPMGKARTATQRLGLVKSEVIHLGEDVTVRYFTLNPASHRVPVGQYQVVHMGEDVTVRYFTPIGRNSTE